MSTDHPSSACPKARCCACPNSETLVHDMETMINALLEAEISSFLHFSKGRCVTASGRNARNGYYQRTFRSCHGNLNIRIPRDRAGDFCQQTLPFYLRGCSPADCVFCELVQGPSSAKEVRSLIGDLYGDAYDTDFLDYLTDTYLSLIESKLAVAGS